MPLQLATMRWQSGCLLLGPACMRPPAASAPSMQPACRPSQLHPKQRISSSHSAAPVLACNTSSQSNMRSASDSNSRSSTASDTTNLAGGNQEHQARVVRRSSQPCKLRAHAAAAAAGAAWHAVHAAEAWGAKAQADPCHTGSWQGAPAPNVWPPCTAAMYCRPPEVGLQEFVLVIPLRYRRPAAPCARAASRAAL